MAFQKKTCAGAKSTKAQVRSFFKSNDDILSHTGKVFYPFDVTRQAITFGITIAQNDSDLEKIEWQIDYLRGGHKKMPLPQ